MYQVWVESGAGNNPTWGTFETKEEAEKKMQSMIEREEREQEKLKGKK